MNNGIKLISKTCNGKVFKCSKCTNIHVDYKNLSFSFTTKEYERFKEFFFTVDGEYWENQNKDSYHKRKIFIPMGHKNFKIAMNSIEVYEVKALLTGKKQQEKKLEITRQEISEKVSLN